MYSRGDPKALPTELRLRHQFFFQQILFNDYIDDTDDNTVDTIWLLDLQSIVEGVDELDGHCLHNHDQESLRETPPLDLACLEIDLAMPHNNNAFGSVGFQTSPGSLTRVFP